MKPYYEDSASGITIYHGDCREVMSQLAPGVCDLILADPPYGVLLGEKARNQKSLSSVKYESYEDTPEALSSLIADVFPLSTRLTSRIVVTPGVRNMWLWPKPNHVGAFYYPSATGCNSWGFSCWQPIFYYGKDPYGGKGSRPDSFQSTESAIRNGHPCPKPIGQWQTLLSRVSMKGETVLDPFVGSGTTLRAAKDLGRRAIGIEKNEAYCEIAVQMLAQEVMFGVAFSQTA